jgi:hypothetical protein
MEVLIFRGFFWERVGDQFPIFSFEVEFFKFGVRGGLSLKIERETEKSRLRKIGGTA